MMIAELGLAWLAVASAFSYFCVFGVGAVMPTLAWPADNQEPLKVVSAASYMTA